MILKSKSAALHSIVVALMVAVSPMSVAAEYLFEGEATRTDVSGVAGTETTLALGSPKGVKTIQWQERKDEPCQFRVWGRNLNNSGLDQEQSFFECGSGPSLNFTDDSLTVGFPKAESEAYIAGVSVCMNNDDTRLKGIRVRGRVPGSAGNLTDTPDEPQKERPNCKSWKRWVDCPEGRLASGVILQVAKGKQPKSVTGLRLLCSAVKVQVVEDTPPRLVGYITATDEVSGAKGQEIELLPAGAKYGLDTIFWGERRDNPCLVRAESRDLADRNQRDSRSADKCDGAIGTGSQSRMDLTTRDTPANFFITGLRVCVNNDRVKGMELELVHVTWSTGDPPKPKDPLDARNHSGSLLNCLISGTKKNWVRCPKGQIAVGINAHFEKGNDQPKSLIGVGLICKAYE